MEAQEHRIKTYCEYKGYELVATIKDDGVSGGINKNRDGFVTLLEICESGMADAIILFSLERLSRDMLTLLALERLMDEYDVQLHTVEGYEVNTSTLEGWMAFVMKVLWSEVERRQVKFRTRKAMEFKKQKSEIVGSVSYGYMREGNKLVPMKEEQDVIEKMNDLYLSDMSLSQIAQEMTSQGINTRAGSEWKVQQVKRVLNGYKDKWKKKKSKLGVIIKDFILSVA